MILLLLSKSKPHFQLLPMSKVDQSLLRIHEVPPLQYPKSHIIVNLVGWFCCFTSQVDSYGHCGTVS